MDKFCTELNATLVETYISIQLIEETMLSDLSNANLTIGEMHMIESIGQCGEDGRTISEIAQALSISAPSVTVTVKKLERKGYVTKTRCAKDGRRVYVRLTDSGRRADISHRFFHRQMVHAVAKAIPDDKKDALLCGLATLNSFFKAKAEALTAKEIDGGNKT